VKLAIALTRKDERPIRVAPTVLLFPRPSALKDIYRDAKLNEKALMYGSGAYVCPSSNTEKERLTAGFRQHRLGPPHLVTTLDGEKHRLLRKALSNAPWTIGPLKNTWETRFDDQVRLFIEKMREHAAAQRTVVLSDKVAEFAADIMSMISFGAPFGSVENQRDEKNILGNWRKGLTFFGFVGRFRFFREKIVKLPRIGPMFLPTMSNTSGMGWLLCEADRQVSAREELIKEKKTENKPDFLQ
jgi:cytochrome P450